MFLYELKDWLLAGGKIDCDGLTIIEKDGILVNFATLLPVPASVYYSMVTPNWNKLDFVLALELGTWYTCSDGQSYKVIDVNVATNMGPYALARSENGKYLLLCTMGGRGKQAHLLAETEDPLTEIQVESIV